VRTVTALQRLLSVSSVYLTLWVDLKVLEAVGTVAAWAVEVFSHARRTFIDMFDIARLDGRPAAVDGVVEQRPGGVG